MSLDPHQLASTVPPAIVSVGFDIGESGYAADFHSAERDCLDIDDSG